MTIVATTRRRRAHPAFFFKAQKDTATTMPEPPKPGSCNIAVLLARLAWFALPGSSLGLFRDEGTGATFGLYLDKGEQWGLYSPDLPGLGPFLVSADTAKMMLHGQCADDGSIAYDSARFLVQATTAEGRLVAVPVREGSAA